MKRFLSLMMIVPALTLVPACGGGDHDGHDHGDSAGAFEGLTTAVCVLTPTEGNTAAGKLTFTQVPDGILIEGTVTGLNPGQKHAYHIHQFGDISAADGTATGGHYNPAGVDHGLPADGSHGDHHHAVATGGHAGDLGNLQADETGTAVVDVTFSNLTMAGNNAIIGRAIIVHAGEDTGAQPTGEAGPRIAQGVIGIAAEPEE